MKKIISNIIIGTGFIAKNFNNYKEELKKLNICLYAAGVSNSQTNNKDLFINERKRLLDFSRQFNQEKSWFMLVPVAFLILQEEIILIIKINYK